MKTLKDLIDEKMGKYPYSDPLDDSLDGLETRTTAAEVSLSAYRKDYDTSSFVFADDHKVRCYHTHKPMLIGAHTIYGGSCIFPQVADADVYIGFDVGMSRRHAYPWDPPTATQEVFFYIRDQDVPSDKANFDKLLEWTAGKLAEGRKVHAGCVGGHGRTGLFLAALVCHMTGEKDALTYVRDAYCHRAVETQTQAQWLHARYGIKLLGGSKPTDGVLTSFNGGSTGKRKQGKGKGAVVPYKATPVVSETVSPMRISTSIWGFKDTPAGG